MIKYFHELTKYEFEELVNSKKYTYGKLAKDYPQPKWCTYPNATEGMMGCWSLMSHMVKDRDFCNNCDCSIEYKQKVLSKY